MRDILSYKSLVKLTQSDFLVEYLAATLYLPSEKFIYLEWKWSCKYMKTLIFFLAVLKKKFCWSFQERYLLCFPVWWWSGLVWDWKCLDYFGRQLAKESENNSALPDQYLWSEQWTQPFALCKYIVWVSLLSLVF